MNIENAWLWLFSIGIPGALDIFIRCRFLSRVLPAKYPPIKIFAITLLFGLIYGETNISFALTTTMITNTIYYYIGDLLLCALLFHGSLLKKVFFTALLTTGYTGLSYSLLPLTDRFPAVNSALIYAIVIIWGLLLELLGRRFQYLKQELPTGLTAYLLFVTLFVFMTSVTVSYFSKMMVIRMHAPYFAFVTAVFSLCGTMVVIFAIFTMDKELFHRLSEQHTRLLLNRLREKESEWSRLTHFRHDITNHLTCLEHLLRSGKTEQALSYLNPLTDTVKQLDSQISTGNEFADAIIYEKMSVMAAKEIQFSEDICLPRECQIEPVSLCCIISNVLDNAIHACEEIDPPGKRWIRACAFVRLSHLVITVENSISDATQKKKNLPQYGIGLANVHDVVTRYGGAMELSKDKTFSFGAMLPLD